MRIEIGSKVKFLNDVGGGTLKAFVGEKMALVETGDGFEITVLVNELLPDTGDFYTDRDDADKRGKEHEKEVTVKKTEPTYEEKRYLPFSGEVFLAIVPHNENVLHVSNFGLFLINTSNYQFNYIVAANNGRINTLVKAGIIGPDSKEEVEVYSQTGIAKVKEFSFQGMFYKEGLFDYVVPVNCIHSISEISFYKIAYFRENEYFKEKALILKDYEKRKLEEAIEELHPNDLNKVIKDKEQIEGRKEYKTPKNTNIEEIDLHIEEILDNTSGMSNAEILEAQMARFEIALQTAIRSNVQKIVFIHGVGNGKLRQELRKTLEKKYAHLRYQDASFKEYGYGATMVCIR